MFMFLVRLPPAIQELAAAAQPFCPEPAGLPDTEQVRGMISSALHTADGKVWRVVQKVIDRREAWPRLARENAATRDFLYLVCRYIRTRPEFFDAMVTAMFEEVYDMDRELPAEVIDAVFKELLVHEGLTFTQCEHVMDKLMQRGEQMEYLFHEWSGVFPTLPAHARQALAKGLLPSIGRCPHAALDFVLKVWVGSYGSNSEFHQKGLGGQTAKPKMGKVGVRSRGRAGKPYKLKWRIDGKQPRDPRNCRPAEEPLVPAVAALLRRSQAVHVACSTWPIDMRALCEAKSAQSSNKDIDEAPALALKVDAEISDVSCSDNCRNSFIC
eukprot:g31158.t1